ncbi:hypothetical protein GAY29_04085 [Azospirillum brasilense]|uniref:hypothetical protein n=1 Tax=Azospirillum brasilense TaxID=192 RepID=UPI00190B336F|nr:hypothetical protein [Azospirillum brasilense]MBK3732290.1 hypothetical protein [Azospirillum brasilense]
MSFVAAADHGENHFHLLPAGELRSIRVSSRSWWYSRAWELDNPTPGARAVASRIAWDVLLPDGSLLTDPQHAELLDTFRRLAWSLLVDPRDGKALKPGSMSNFSVGMRTMVRWMISRKYRTLANLDSEASLEFLEDLPRILARDLISAAPVEGEDEVDLDAGGAGEEVEDDASGDEISPGVLYVRTCVWAQAFRQSEALRDAGIEPMPERPFDGDDAWTVAKRLTTATLGQIPPLPDEVALPVLAAATQWLEQADAIIARHAHYLSGGAIRTVLAGRNQRQALRVEFERLTNACVILLQGLTGVRIGEICGLVGGWNEADDTPSCVTKRTSRTGLNEIFYMQGKLAKTRAAPEDVEWLLGARPKGSNALPMNVRALVALERLMALWRPYASTDRLIVKFSTARGVPLPSEDGKVTQASALKAVDATSLNRTQQNFVVAEVDLSGLPDTNSRQEDLSPYRETRGRCIRSHQWRKTFAHYVMLTRSPKEMLPALSQHFKHVSLAMTEQGYIIKDPYLRQAMEAAPVAATVAFFMEAARGKVVIGRMGELIDQHRDELRRLAEGDPDAAYGRIERWVRVHDIRIFFAPHGKCAMSLNTMEARCHDVAGTASPMNTGPNLEVRRPPICAGCAVHIIDADHAEFWVDRYLTNARAFAEAERNGVAREYRVVEDRARQAAAMLRQLNIDIPPLENADAA